MSDIEPVEVAEATGRPVVMQDGSTVVFGDRANRKSVMDLDSNSITFYIATGEIIRQEFVGLQAFDGLENLSVFFRRIILDGIRAKVNSQVGATPLVSEEFMEIEVDGQKVKKPTGGFVHSLAKSIQDSLAEIASGVYTNRAMLASSSRRSYRSLTTEQEAYALTAIHVASIFAAKQGTVEWTVDGLHIPNVTADVRAAWAALPKEQQAVVKKSVPFKKFKADLVFARKGFTVESQAVATPVGLVAVPDAGQWDVTAMEPEPEADTEADALPLAA
jgi:hypothetical protein